MDTPILEDVQAEDEPQKPRRMLEGPDVKVRAPAGVVATRSEIQDELNRRRAYGVIRNSF